jgi:hypothetical protein
VPDPEPPAAGEQLRLKLEQTSPPAEKTATVVTFIDAGTRAVRRDAIERVKSSGIFHVPDPNSAR